MVFDAVTVAWEAGYSVIVALWPGKLDVALVVFDPDFHGALALEDFQTPLFVLSQ